MTCGNDELNEEQKDVARDIANYGAANGFTREQIQIALKVAFQESSLGQNLTNSSSTARGLFQYNNGTWSDHHSHLNRDSFADQTQAFFVDLFGYTADYNAARASGAIPADISLGEFVYVMHHDGRYTSDANVPSSGAIAVFDAIPDFCLDSLIDPADAWVPWEHSEVTVPHPDDDLAFWAWLGDVPVYDDRFGLPRGTGRIGDSEYIPPDGGPPTTIPGDAGLMSDYLLFR